ncbi:MAG: hypothetical protein KC483_07900 [Nitrosarchaeum sp.]|nr:hypothetical protein [Nitrosarchaeum sp.]
MRQTVITFFSLLAILSGLSFANAFGEIDPNSAFILEGSGFAVTEDIIKVSEIDIVMSTQRQSGSAVNSLIEDGFITLDDLDYLASDLQATFLREGKYVRINGNIEDDSGSEVSIRFFGRLIEESKSASVYSFTGRITSDDDSYKIIYTTKLSKLTKVTPSTTSSKPLDDLTIHIVKGAASRGLSDSYIDIAGVAKTNGLTLNYFTKDRIVVEPKTTITVVNDDLVSHSILSGKENYGDRHNRYTADGRISTGEILPGKSITITFDDAGFYRLYDPNYQWMNIVAYVFPNVDNIILGQGNPGN